MKPEVIFLTVANLETRRETKLMLDSLRTFGGDLKDAPFLVFAVEWEKMGLFQDNLTQVIPLHLSGGNTPCLFERKVTACARAEEMAPPEAVCLVWVDPGVVFTAPPMEFLLGAGYQAAFRPVHIRNVGLSIREPLDSFWQGICAAIEVEDVPGKIISFVDGQEIRSYFNTHAFSFRPGLGLMKEWLNLFLSLALDEHFQAEACADELHRVFLFQALLSVLIASRLGEGRVKMLPPAYNYPYHFQDRIPVGEKMETLNQAVCFVYEDKQIHPEKLQGIGVTEPLRGWLMAHLQD